MPQLSRAAVLSTHKMIATFLNRPNLVTGGVRHGLTNANDSRKYYARQDVRQPSDHSPLEILSWRPIGGKGRNAGFRGKKG